MKSRVLLRTWLNSQALHVLHKTEIGFALILLLTVDYYYYRIRKEIEVILKLIRFYITLDIVI